ncbi:Alpha/Beta hydrolase protein [Kalaharituber pfeilii]|nr:Alpha/Beta hydrolase protein [Kalaharituber pfeilii]
MGIPKLGWPSTQDCYHSAKTVGLKLRNGSVVQLSELAKSTLTPFRAHPLLPNGHLQTFWTVATSADIPVYYARKILVGKDGGTFTVDFVVPPSENHTSEGLWHRTRYMTTEEQKALPSDDSKPMLLALHGLTGGSHELYLRAVVHPLVEKYGWGACVMNARGCAKSKITTHQLFNARVTGDVRETVDFLRTTFPNRPLYGVGFSLGANIFANYLGEEGDKCVLKGAALCSNPWNLHMTNHLLHQTWLGAEVYSRAMGTQYDVLASDPKVDAVKVRKSKYIYEFDRDLTARVFGYATVGAYYRDASSVDRLLSIRVPTFIVHAADDPVAISDAVPYDEVEANPYAFLVVDFMRKFHNEVEEVLPVKLDNEEIKAKL